MNTPPTATLDRVGDVLRGLPATDAVRHAAAFLIDGFNEHVEALGVYTADGRVSEARAAELVEVYSRQLLGELLTLSRQLGAEGGAA